jgi:hypothetical protein
MIKFDAWDNIFTGKQIAEIINMSRHAYANGITLHDALSANPPKLMQPRQVESRVTKKAGLMLCPVCGRILNASAISSQSDKYKEGYRTYFLCGAACCTGKGCGYEEYSKLTIDEILKGVKNGTT